LYETTLHKDQWIYFSRPLICKCQASYCYILVLNGITLSNATLLCMLTTLALLQKGIWSVALPFINTEGFSVSLTHARHENQL